MAPLQPPVTVPETHKPDGREIDVNPIIKIIEFILRYANATLAQKNWDEKDKLDVHGVLDVLSTHTIKKISLKIAEDSIAVGDADATTMHLLGTILSKYKWEAKVALTFAAFAVNYAEFLLMTELYPEKPLAKSIALLKESMEVIELSDLRESKRFSTLNKLIQAMLDVTNCLVEFGKLPESMISTSLLKDDIANAAYGTILSLVACGSQFASLTNNGYEYIKIMEERDVSNFRNAVTEIHKKLLDQLEHFHKSPIDSQDELHKLCNEPESDNLAIRILTALINPWNDPNPLLDGGHDNAQVTIEESLKGKKVLLFISDHKLSQEEVDNFVIIYNDSKSKTGVNPYEVVWLPIIDRSIHFNRETREKLSEKLKSITWPWYKPQPTTLLEPWVIKYIKEEWHFEKKPILVALEPKGKLIVSPDAIDRMLILGDAASPFAGTKGEHLWQEETQATLIKLLLFCVLDTPSVP